LDFYKIIELYSRNIITLYVATKTLHRMAAKLEIVLDLYEDKENN